MRVEITYTDLAGRKVLGAIWGDAPGTGCKWVVPLDGGPRRYVKVRITEGSRPSVKEVAE